MCTARSPRLSPSRRHIRVSPRDWRRLVGKSDRSIRVVVAKRRCSLDAREDLPYPRRWFYCHRGPTRVDAVQAASCSRHITGMRVKTLLDGGAYGSYACEHVLYGALQTLTYRSRPIPFRAAACSRTPPCWPKRGHGPPQPLRSVNSPTDRETLAIDPADLRTRIIVKQTRSREYLRCNSGRADASACDAVRNWPGRSAAAFGRGVGLACSSYLSGAGLRPLERHAPSVHLKLDRAGLHGLLRRTNRSGSTMCWSVACGGLGSDPLDIRRSRRHDLPPLIWDPIRAAHVMRATPHSSAERARIFWLSVRRSSALRRSSCSRTSASSTPMIRPKRRFRKHLPRRKCSAHRHDRLLHSTEIGREFREARRAVSHLFLFGGDRRIERGPFHR